MTSLQRRIQGRIDANRQLLETVETPFLRKAIRYEIDRFENTLNDLRLQDAS